jgi:integrase
MVVIFSGNSQTRRIMTTTIHCSDPKLSRKLIFTNNRLEKLSVPKSSTCNQIEYSDLACVGLKLIHSCLTGRKKFHQRLFLPGGKKTGINLGEFPAVSVELAREIANANKALAAQGINPTVERQKRLNKLTFKEFSEQMYIPLAKTTKRSWRDDLSKLEKDMYPSFGTKPLEELTKSDVIKYIAKIQKRTSNSTANRHRALLSYMLNVAIDHELLEKNVVESVSKYGERTKFGRSLTADEQEKLLIVLGEEVNQKAALAIKLLLMTGMRKMECLQIKWRNINFDEKHVTLEMATTKGKRERNVVLNSSAMAIIEKLKNHRETGNPYIFPGSNKGMNLTTVKRTFERCKKAAGITNFRLHDCRHNFCSLLVAENVSQPVIQELLGHRSPAMTQRYIHLQPKTLHESAQLVSNIFCSII